MPRSTPYVDPMTPDPREEKLPVWAAVALERLRDKLQHAEAAAKEARLGNGPADTDTLMDPYADRGPILLPKGERIRFITGREQEGRVFNDWADVSVKSQSGPDGDRRYVEVMAGHGLQVEPKSSNVIKVWLT